MEKNRQQGEINKVLPCAHFGFVLNEAGGIGLTLAEKLQLVSGMSIWMLLSEYGKLS